MQNTEGQGTDGDNQRTGTATSNKSGNMYILAKKTTIKSSHKVYFLESLYKIYIQNLWYINI